MAARCALVVHGLAFVDTSRLSRGEVHLVVVALLALLLHGGSIITVLYCLVHPVLTLAESNFGNDFTLCNQGLDVRERVAETALTLACA